MKVPTIWRKLSIFKEIGAIILIPTKTFQPFIHLPLETMRTCLLEVECNKVKDQCRTLSKIMLHMFSKDNTTRAVIEQTIQAQGGPNLLRNGC